jgi:hypothetical protein
MARETRTVTDEDRLLAAVLVEEALEKFDGLPAEQLEALWAELMDLVLWTQRGREALRRLAMARGN